VLFANGERARVDFSEIIGQGPWERLADPSFLNLAHAAYDTVVLNDDVDVSPELVWEKAHLATEFGGAEPGVPLPWGGPPVSFASKQMLTSRLKD
jgi:hypothetical protein